MDNFVSRENIRRYRKLAGETTNAAERSRITNLLTEEEAKLKLELGTTRDVPQRPVDAPTEKQVEHGGEEQQGGG
jgi:hypothetical protein